METTYIDFLLEFTQDKKPICTKLAQSELAALKKKLENYDELVEALKKIKSLNYDYDRIWKISEQALTNANELSKTTTPKR